ncbi:uncharacterized protein BYT42DRAFT_557508, partial [Radiomyces spectabilis]|uniref:uncharacterized protein n=1 Tax=Radiomyces spectabilis TaxID=64574 RepID=UPI00221F90DF
MTHHPFNLEIFLYNLFSPLFLYPRFHPHKKYDWTSVILFAYGWLFFFLLSGV